MAGSPRKRARRERAKRASQVATPIGTAPAHHTPAPARGGAGGGTRAPGTVSGLGPRTRDASDRAQADSMRELASALQLGITCHIERVRPTWCRGWIEDYPLDGESIGELKAYLRDQHGGTDYKVVCLAENGAPLFSAKLPISGPPKEEGYPIDRDEYETAQGGRRPGAPARTNGGNPADAFAGLASIMTLVLNEARESRNATLESVREMSKETRESTDKLVQQVVKVQEEDQKRASLPSQLAELSESVSAVEEIKKTFTPDQEPQRYGSGDMDELVHIAGRRFMERVIDSKVPAKQPDRPERPASAASIPDAQTAPRKR